MNFLLLLIIAVILLALVVLSFMLNSSFSRKKESNVTSCSIAKDKELKCGCDNVENCYNKQV